jgi:glutaredoxin
MAETKEVIIITSKTCTRCPVVKRRLKEICGERGIKLEIVDLEQLPVDLETDLAMEGIMVISLPCVIVHSAEKLVNVDASQPGDAWVAEIERLTGGSKE